jgi:hypothetical protein
VLVLRHEVGLYRFSDEHSRMKSSGRGRRALMACAAAAILAGCAPGGMPQMRTIAGPASSAGRGKSWMKPSASNALLYVDDDKTNDTYVYDYPSGKLVGTLTGFYDPRGMCVDQKGDVYITNHQYGLLIEYAHGGTKPLNVYEDPGHGLIGCSVSAAGDVAATGGNVCIWKRGVSKNSPTCIEGNSACGIGLTFGYDHDGDLVGIGGSKDRACMIPAGKNTLERLSTRGIRFKFDPEGTSWDGKYIALGSYYQFHGAYENVVQVATLSGTTLTAVRPPIALLDDCDPGDSSIVNLFFFGKQNVTAASTTRATRVTGPNQDCKKSGKGVVDVWNYPKTGHEPILRIPAGRVLGGDAVSIQE